jgi:hypothetical protein
LSLHNLVSKCIRTASDPSILDYMKGEVFNLLESDEICFREAEDNENEYKRKLSLH